MSARLGDQFSLDYQEDFFRRHFVPGAVFRILTFQTTPPKFKRFVVIGLEHSSGKIVGSLFINTSMVSAPYLHSLQLPLMASDCEFLEHDSFLDCSRIYEEDASAVKAKYLADTEIYLGALSVQDLKQAIAMVRKAKTISVATKRRFGLL